MTTDPAASGPAQDATGHVDPDRLADLAEGLLEGSAAEAVRDHLASCEQCADDFALITLDSGLAGFLAPEPIPAEVVARVEAALYREPPLRESTESAASTSASASARQHVHHAARPSRARRFKLAFGALASIALLVGGVTVGVSMFGGAGEKTSTAASGASGAAAPNAASRYSGGVPAAPTDALVQLQQQATGLLAAAKNGGTGAASSTAKGHPDNALRTPNPAAETCWQNPSPSADLLAHGPIVFQGQPAELLVYADPGDSTRAKVVVVAAGCASLDAKTSVPEPQQTVDGTPLSGSGSAPSPVVLAETSITRP